MVLKHKFIASFVVNLYVNYMEEKKEKILKKKDKGVFIEYVMNVKINI